ncbi:uncharacterized protein MONOS_17317 [Monocercomonoides exilis]|uniref:uncharacterized protein n=1 Tax=Monocercomonoides exilis TaxID=2049356 RepID=UPI00355A847F|nr:hypothetical protein MONOS_17317 [Monocercomonoides exilis]
METVNTKKFTELFSDLERCNKEEQKQKILEMNEAMEEMDEKEFKSVFTTELFDKICRMIEERKIYLKDSILMLKHVGYFNVLKCACINCFENSSLKKKVGEIIIEEEHKKEEKNEKIFVDLCKCYISLSYNIPPELRSICVLCLLKAALNKEESEEVQKEVEMALLALSNIGIWKEIERKQYLNEITEIVRNHQKHRNLTHLAYLSAWRFFINRFFFNEDLESVIENELHFAREATRELEDLMKCVDWKKKEEEMSREETKYVNISERWIQKLNPYIESCRLRSKEYAKLIRSIVQVFRVAKDNHREIRNQCIYSLRNAAISRALKIDGLLENEAVGVILEEIQQPTLNDKATCECLSFFIAISWRLEEGEEDEADEAKRKATKRKAFDKIEEEGYEDITTSFHELMPYFSSITENDIPSEGSSVLFVHL